jgi:hypothetical protein
MQVNSVLSSYQVAANNTASSNTASNELDSSQFMQILMAQLERQIFGKILHHDVTNSGIFTAYSFKIGVPDSI